jgi:hypothetical protein
MLTPKQIQYIALSSMGLGVVGMLFSASQLGSHNLNNVNQGGFVLVAGVLLFGIGLFALLFISKK